MVQQLLHIIIISAICIIWGLPSYFFLKRSHSEESWYGKGVSIFIFLFFSGLFSLAVLSSWLVLLIPLKFYYLLIATVLLLLVLPFFCKRTTALLYQHLRIKENITLFQYVFVISCILLFIILGSQKSVNIDTQLYHLQIIRWTNEYGTVPGLVNLYPRLGLGSNWFNLISLFHIPAFNHQNFTFLNSTTTIWFLLWLMSKWRYYYKLDDTKPHARTFIMFYFLLILYFLFDWQLFRDTANSTSYDFIVAALTIAVISFITEGIFTDKKNDFSLVLIILSLLIIPFKLSGLFILIPVLFYLVNFRNKSVWLKSFLAGCIILFPLFARNYIITGYPLFPSTLTVGSPEWQLPKEMALKFKEYIFYVNKFYDQQIGFIFAYDKTTFNWIPFWIGSILIKHKILFILSSLSFLLFYYNPHSQIKHTKIRLFIISLWLMVAGWFFTAPDPRFALGFLLFLAFFPLSFFVGKYIPFKKISDLVFSITTLIILTYTIKKSEPLFKQPRFLYHVVNSDMPPFQTAIINDVTFNTPEKINANWNNRCFFIPLPCICETNPFVQPRNKNIRKGFMMKPIPDSIFIQNYNY